MAKKFSDLVNRTMSPESQEGRAGAAFRSLKKGVAETLGLSSRWFRRP